MDENINIIFNKRLKEKSIYTWNLGKQSDSILNKQMDENVNIILKEKSIYMEVIGSI